MWVRYLEEKEEGTATLTARTPINISTGRTLIRSEEDFISVSTSLIDCTSSSSVYQPQLLAGFGSWGRGKSSALLHGGILGHVSPPHHIQEPRRCVPAVWDWFWHCTNMA